MNARHGGTTALALQRACQIAASRPHIYLGGSAAPGAWPSGNCFSCLESTRSNSYAMARKAINATSDAAHYQQNDHHQQDQAEAAARPIAPPRAVRPARQGSNQ